MNAPENLKPSTKATFNWPDPLLLDAQLREEERMVRDAAQAYAQDKLMPRVTEAFRHEKSDPAIFREMGALGLLGATSFAEVEKSMLYPATPTNMPGVFSAFPLLDIEPYRY